LPESVREELNKRLRNGELGAQLLPWLNGLEETRRVCGEFFGGAEINGQNLSDWRAGGYEEWSEKQDKTYRVKELASFAAGLARANGGSIAEGAAAIASGKLLELLETAESEPDGPPGKKGLNLEQLGDVVTSLTSLRSAEIAQQRADIDREKLKRKDEELALARAAFDQRLKEYQDKVAAQKREIENALGQVKAGGLTPETLRKIEEAARLL
jgi:hypothetical protein